MTSTSDTADTADTGASTRIERTPATPLPRALLLIGVVMAVVGSVGGPLITSVAKLLPASTRESGDKFWIAQTRDVHTATAAAYGLILVTDPREQAQQMLGGRLLQRIHLSATARGLALQHMNQITERIDRDSALGRDSVFGPRLQTLVAAAGRPGLQVLSAFRIGHPVRGGRRTPRRDVAEVTR